ncbi:MAG: N-acetyltransferase [Burkholderiales bacterium]|nr:N-acetyltransferase [Burkholderiales bacterium]
MNSTDAFTSAFTDMLTAPAEAYPPVRIKELAERDRRRMLMHFLALNDQERLLRFGSAMPDELITKYVQKIQFSRDAVFGVYDADLQLLAVAHLAYLPRGASPGSPGNTTKQRVAEFGVSVLASARGRGIGTKLFERAAMHCRNNDVDTLYVHCLTSNQVMMHIARKAGMEIHRDHGEADAYLKLPPADARSVLQEAMDEQVASLDYTLKTNSRILGKWIGQLPGLKAE